MYVKSNKKYQSGKEFIDNFMITKEYHDGIFIEQQTRVPTFMMNYEHTHNYCEIFYLKKGMCTYTVEKKKYHLSAGDIFIVRAGDSHSTCYEGTEECQRLVIACNSDLLHKEFLDKHPEVCRTISTSGKVVLSDMVKNKLEALFSDMMFENDMPDDYSSDLMILLVMKLLLIIQRHGIFVYEQLDSSNEISSDIEQAINYIALNYSLSLTLDEISSMFGLCPSYFSKKFKQETGMTFKEYVNYIRLHKAIQMLLTTDDSITKIALACGFNSSNYFKDCFHKSFNISPREYRKLRISN